MYKPMKPPISYYGGKQKMASKIVPLIPKHTVYVEPFAGGAAIMFAKPWPDVTNTHHYREVINDLDGDLINFYTQLRDNGEELCRLLQLTMYSEEEHRTAKDFQDCSDLERARRYFVNSQQSFVNQIGGGWGRSVFGENQGKSWANKVARLPEYLDRMSSVTISHTDAIKCIQQWDSPQTLFYCDPPYVGADQRYRHTLTQGQMAELCETLDNIQGSFLLSCYANEAVKDHWERFSFGTTCSAKGRSGYDRTKKADESNQNRKRTELVFRKISSVPVRDEIQKLYDSGKFDCFMGVASSEYEEFVELLDGLI